MKWFLPFAINASNLSFVAQYVVNAMKNTVFNAKIFNVQRNHAL